MVVCSRVSSTCHEVAFMRLGVSQTSSGERDAPLVISSLLEQGRMWNEAVASCIQYSHNHIHTHTDRPWFASHLIPILWLECVWLDCRIHDCLTEYLEANPAYTRRIQLLIYHLPIHILVMIHPFRAMLRITSIVCRFCLTFRDGPPEQRKKYGSRIKSSR